MSVLFTCMYVCVHVTLGVNLTYRFVFPAHFVCLTYTFYECNFHVYVCICTYATLGVNLTCHVVFSARFCLFDISIIRMYFAHVCIDMYICDIRSEFNVLCRLFCLVYLTDTLHMNECT